MANQLFCTIPGNVRNAEPRSKNGDSASEIVEIFGYI